MRSSSEQVSLLDDTSHAATPRRRSLCSLSAEKGAHTTLNLGDKDSAELLRAFHKSKKHPSHHSRTYSSFPQGAWVSVSKGRVTLSRKALLLLGVCLATLALAGALRSYTAPQPSRKEGERGEEESSTHMSSFDRGFKMHKYAGPRQWPRQTFSPLPLTKVLNHDSPQPTLKEQLKDGVRYLATMSFGGHANQFIAIQKMLFLAKSTNRVAVVPSLIPIHIDGLATPMSDFYDLDRFNAQAGVPAVEFASIKEIDLESARPTNERVSCWSTQELAVGYANVGMWAFDVHDVAVDHWPLPPMSRAMNEIDIAFDSLRMFDHGKKEQKEWVEKVRREMIPQWNEAQRKQLEAMGTPVKSLSLEDNIKTGFDPRGTSPPEDQFLCYDNTLFMGPVSFEDALADATGSKAELVAGEDASWRDIGQHLHFNRELESIADEYLVELFDCGDALRIPPFLSVHLRRGDFKDFTGFTDLDRYISGLTRLRTKLQARLDNPYASRSPETLEHFRHFGIKADEYPVVVTTDELPGTEFWREVERMGWKIINHSQHQTKVKRGAWYMTMVDGAVLARGQGFVGTPESTFSHLAGLRVKYWNGGLVESATKPE